ncbi:hypothetical protein Q7P37_007121 [Cladosporium fusiforme]
MGHEQNAMFGVQHHSGLLRKAKTQEAFPGKWLHEHINGKHETTGRSWTQSDGPPTPRYQVPPDLAKRQLEKSSPDFSLDLLGLKYGICVPLQVPTFVLQGSSQRPRSRLPSGKPKPSSRLPHWASKEEFNLRAHAPENAAGSPHPKLNMIKTHRPRGHHWTCASHFQQSKQYRNLDAESHETCLSKTLAIDPDDGQPGDLRAAKRQKIEDLANGFLDGKPLFISSASSNGHELTTSVENVLHERRLGWDELLDDHDENLWADGEDGWSFLRKRSKQRAASKPSRDAPRKTLRTTQARITETPLIKRTPQPSEPSEARSRPNVSIAPSEDALARAAELRARKGSLTSGAVGMPGQLVKLPGHVAHSAPPTAKAPLSFKQCSSSRPFNPQTPAETTMADELRLSRTESPSHRPRAFTVPPVSFASDATVEDPSSGVDGNATMHLPRQDDHIALAPSAPPNITGSTAMDICTAEQNRKSSFGPGLAAWTPINTKHTNSETVDSVTRSSRMQSTNSAHKVSTRGSTGPTRQSKTTPSQKTRNEASQSSSQSQLTRSFQASKAKVTVQEKSQNGSTPFMYRKKTRASKNEQVMQAEATSMQHFHEKDPQASEVADVTPKPSDPTTLPSVSAAPPTLDMSFQHDSSFAPNLNLALVDEHLNRRLPKSPDSAHRSYSVKKALRREMRLSGADFSRVSGENSSPPPYEPHEETLGTNVSAENDHTSQPQRRSTGQWPGTQVLLNQAQYDLFISPDKLVSATAATCSGQQEHNADVSQVRSLDHAPRRPLQQLSQEHLPGTQALMDNWSPWSTVKKGKKRASFAPSPLVSKDDHTPASTTSRSLSSCTKRPHAPERVCETEPRRSSLRFATSTIETPMTLAHKQYSFPKSTKSPVCATPASFTNPHGTNCTIPTPSNNPEHTNTDINLNLSTLSFAATDAQTFADVDDSMMEWSSHDKLSSFQHAQDASVDPAPEQIMADIASEFLSTADIDILGRV